MIPGHASPTEAPATAKRLVYCARGLTKVYRTGEVEVRALAGVDLDLHQGQLVVLLGWGQRNKLNAHTAGCTRPRSRRRGLQGLIYRAGV